MSNFIASSGDVVDCNKLNTTTSPSKLGGEPKVDAKLVKKKGSDLELKFSLSACRNMAGAVEEDPLPL